MTGTQSLTEQLRRHGPIAVLCAGVFSFLSWVSVKVFLGYPLCMDEYNYLYQAKIFASGHRFLMIPAIHQPLTETYMLIDGSRIFSKYLPLWSMVLSLGERMSAASLVNPFLSAMTVFFVYRTARLVASPRSSFLASLLLGLWSYFVGYGASYYAHSLSLTLSSIALYTYANYEISPSLILAAIMGVIAGLLVMLRPGDALCMSLAIAFGMSRRAGPWSQRLSSIAVMASVSALGLMAILIYNHTLIGSWQLSLYDVPYEFPFLDSSSENMSPVLKAVEIFSNNVVRVLLPTLFDTVVRNGVGLPLLMLLGLITGVRGFRGVALMHAVLLVCLFNFHPGNGWPEYGIRHWYPGIAGLVVMAAVGLDWMTVRSSRTVAFTIVMLATLQQVLYLGSHLRTYQKRFDAVATVQADIFRAFPRPGIVALKDPDGSLWLDNADWAVNCADFKRNMFGKGPHFYTIFESEDDYDLVRFFPNLPHYVYDFSVYDRLSDARWSRPYRAPGVPDSK